MTNMVAMSLEETDNIIRPFLDVMRVEEVVGISEDDDLIEHSLNTSSMTAVSLLTASRNPDILTDEKSTLKLEVM